MTEPTDAASDAAFEDNSATDGRAGFTRIGEMAKKFNVTLRTLRFYEDRGLIHPRREGTTRLYSRRDSTRLKLVLLGRRVGFSLREVKQIMDLYERDGSNARQLKLLIEKSQRQLGRLEVRRDAVNEAIGELKKIMSTARARLDAETPIRRVG